jgi:hypothetical protein
VSSLDVRTRRISEKFLRIFHVFEVFLKIFFQPNKVLFTQLIEQ